MISAFRIQPHAGSSCPSDGQTGFPVSTAWQSGTLLRSADFAQTQPESEFKEH